MRDPPIRGLLRRLQQPGRDLPRRRHGAPRPRSARTSSRSCTTRSCRTPRATPISCCPPPPTWRRRTSTALRHLLHAVRPPCVDALGRGAAQSSSWRRRWPGGSASPTPIFRWAPTTDLHGSSAAPPAPAATVDPATLRDRGPLNLAPEPGAPDLPHAVRQARVLLGAPRRRRACRPCPTGQPDARGGARRRPLAAAAAHRARLLPEPHRLLRGGLPAPRGRARPAASCTPTMRARAACATAKARLSNDRGAVGLALRVSDEMPPRRGPRARASGPTRRPYRAPSTCSSRTATPTSARARRTRTRGSRCAAPS